MDQHTEDDNVLRRKKFIIEDEDINEDSIKPGMTDFIVLITPGMGVVPYFEETNY